MPLSGSIACSAQFESSAIHLNCSLEHPIREELLAVFNQRYALFGFNSLNCCASVEENWCVFLLVTIYPNGPDKIGVSLLFFRREFFQLCVLSIFVYWTWEIWQSLGL